MNADLKIAADAVRGATSVVLACHMNPDGDALGSMMGMYHAMHASGKSCIASFPSPFIVGDHYRDIPGLDAITPPSEFPAEPDIMITFDCGSLARLGDLEPAAKSAGELIVIDHHVSNDRYGSINVIDPHAAASGVIARQLLNELDIPLNRDAAVSLYIALVCDTGRFQYSSTTPSVFALAQELSGFDFSIEKISRHLFEEHPFNYLRFMGETLATATLNAEKSFVWVAVTQEQMKRHGITIEDTEGLIDIVRRAREAEVACVLKEDAEGRTRGSLRSLGKVDVQSVAGLFGGGGHQYAAGFTVELSFDEVVARIQGAL